MIDTTKPVQFSADGETWHDYQLPPLHQGFIRQTPQKLWYEHKPEELEVVRLQDGSTIRVLDFGDPDSEGDRIVLCPIERVKNTVDPWERRFFNQDGFDTSKNPNWQVMVKP